MKDKEKNAIKLIKFLYANKIINEKKYNDILSLYKEKNDSLDSILISQKVVNNDTILLLLAEALKHKIITIDDLYNEFTSIDIDKVLQLYAKATGKEFIDLYNIDVNYALCAKIGYEKLNKLGALAYKEDDLNIYFAVKDPSDLELQDALSRLAKNKLVKVKLANYYQIQKHLYNIEKRESVKDLVAEIRDDFRRGKSEAVGESSGILKLIDLILKAAIVSGGSDIHIEPTESNCIVRTRIDGMLNEIFVFDKDIYPPLSSRLKLLANLDIAEKRKPQDGRFSSVVMDKNYDFRISTLPIMNGESIVMRILDKSKIMIKLEDLGMHPVNYQKFKEAMNSPYGIIFVTGPTGSGKTTTLYAGLNAIKDISKKIITVEDPVEYQMSLIQQVQVNPKANLTFASALRSILRQDPDIVMIGEVRDRETLKIAVEASLTGHLVFSTLHTNDAVSAITRIVDMGIEPYLVSGALVAIQAQRLVRKLCPHCKVPITLPDDTLEDVKGYLKDDKYQFYKAKGCDKCMDSGYSGREMVSEVLLVDEKIQSMIARGKSKEEILDYALSKGFLTMFGDAVIRASKGRTTIEEAYRVAKG